MDKREAYSESLKAKLSAMGTFLRAQFDDVSRKRSATEDRFLKDLRQYRGIYDPEVEKKLSKNRSRLFSRITRTKVKAFDARMTEMLFPANNDKNWEISPTPRPNVAETPLFQQMKQAALSQKLMAMVEQVAQQQQIDPEQAQRLLAEQMQQGMIPPPQLAREEQVKLAEVAADQSCANMRSVIADQLAEIKYRKLCSRVIHSGNLFGTGILKGPLVQLHSDQQWQMAEGGEGWELGSANSLLPYLEFVPVWDFYPDPDARSLPECEFMYQRHVKTRDKVVELAHLPEFDKETIVQYLQDVRGGDCEVRDWENLIDGTNEHNDTHDRRPHNRYEVLEFWGALNGSQMAELGLDVDDVDPGDTRWVNLWVLGEFIIKATVTPIDGMDHIYHCYYFDKDETSFWAEGLAALMRDDQSGVNASIRAMMDNAARTVGPMWEVNVDLLPPGERTRDIYPDRMIFRRGAPQSPALRAIQTESRIKEFMAIRDTFENNIHENTVPSYMHGNQDGGVGRTVGGLSMLMGAANVNIKEQIGHFDEGITKTVIAGFYHWNMLFNPDPMVKGDYSVVARGSTSLVAKELRAQQLDQLLPVISTPQFLPFINSRVLLGEIFKARDLDDTEILLDEQQVNDRSVLQQQISELGEQLAWYKAYMQNLHKTAPSLARELTDSVKPGDVQNFLQGGMGQPMVNKPGT